eukprot:9750023-Ditylum_brightwellii.AAC.2
MGVEIEEEVMPSREELDALVRRVENPVCNVCTNDDNTNSVNTGGGRAGTFVLISDEEMRKMRVKELQEELVKCEEAYWEELTPQSVPVEEPDSPFQAQACNIPEEEHDHMTLKYNFNQTMC